MFDHVPFDAVRCQITALIPVYMNVVMMGTSSGWLPNAIYFLLTGGDVHATPTQCATIASFSELGRIVFAIPAGMLADKFGRRKMIICTSLLTFFAWLGLSLCTCITTIYVARFILGTTVALVNAIALPSIGEIASPAIRGQLTSLYQISMSVGVILPALVGAIFPLYKALAWGITFFAVVNIVCLYWITETPNFLVSISQMDQAKETLKRIRKGDKQKEIEEEFEKLKKYIENEKANKSKQNLFKFLKSKSIRKPMLLGFFTNFFAISTGGILLRAYITSILPSNDYIPKRYYPLLNQILSLIIATMTTFYIDKFPRKTIFLFGGVTVMSANVVCAITEYFYEEQHIEYVFKVLFMGSNILLVFFYGASVQPINSAIKSELYPQAIKGLCGSVGIISQASATILLYQMYNFMKDHFHSYFTYVIMSINSLILCLIIFFLLPEGRGASLTDVQMNFNEEPAPCESVDVQKDSKK